MGQMQYGPVGTAVLAALLTRQQAPLSHNNQVTCASGLAVICKCRCSFPYLLPKVPEVVTKKVLHEFCHQTKVYSDEWLKLRRTAMYLVSSTTYQT